MKNSILGSVQNACGHGSSILIAKELELQFPLKGERINWNIHKVEYYSAKKLLIMHHGSISETLLSKTMFIFW